MGGGMKSSCGKGNLLAGKILEKRGEIPREKQTTKDRKAVLITNTVPNPET